MRIDNKKILKIYKLYKIKMLLVPIILSQIFNISFVPIGVII